MRFTAFSLILRSRRAARAACMATGFAFAAHAHAEGKVRIVDQFGIEAAAIYIRQDGSTLSPAFVERILNDPGTSFATAPQNTWPLGTFLHRVGVIRNEPRTWRDYFFDDQPALAGS
jgi:NitT/TauT family transport system substrate-binding protein